MGERSGGPRPLSNDLACETRSDGTSASGGGLDLLPRTRRDRIGLAMLAAFVVAVALTLPLARQLLEVDVQLGGHAHDGYVELARSIAAGEGFVFEPDGAPVFHRPPLYPVLIAPIMWLPEPWHRPAIALIDVILLVATVWLVFQLGMACFDRRVGELAAVFVVANPWALWKVGVGMIPILQMFLSTALITALTVALTIPSAHPRAPSASRFLAIGVLAAALVLTHGGMLLTVAALFAGTGLVVLARGGVRSVAMLAVAFLVMIACISPWTLRNHAVTGRVIPVAGNMGFAYFLNKTHWSVGEAGRDGGGQSPVWGRPAAVDTLESVAPDGEFDEQYHFYGLKDPALDARLNRLMWTDILEHPSGYASRVGLNALEYFVPITWPLWMRGERAVGEILAEWKIRLSRSLASMLLIALALVGVARSGSSPRQPWVLWLLFAAAALATPYALIYAARSDYWIGTIPILSILAALAVFPRSPQTIRADGRT